MQQPVIVGGNRIPFARSDGPYAEASNQDMLTTAIDGLVGRFGLQGERLGEVVAGAVLKHARDFNLTRESVLGSALASETPAYDMQQACDTGLQTTIAVANKIALGQIEAGIAGGVDTTSDAPLGLNEDLRRTLLEARRTKSTPGALKLLGHLRPGQIVPDIPQNAEPRTGLSMGESAAITAEEWGIAREDQDELAATSHQNAARAWERGFFSDLVTPYLGARARHEPAPGLDAPRSSPSSSRCSATGETGTMTAGNSTPLSDGASAVLLATEEWAKERSLPVLARDHRVRDRRGRPRPQRRRAAHGAGVRGAADARAQGPDAPGLRPLRDPRGVRLAGARHAQGVGGPGRSTASASAATSRSARSTAPSSTSPAARSPSATRSPRPAGGSSPRRPSCSTSAAAAGR